ncbi:MAG: tRNA (adenosine(37)-N6)-threonylcarbamoyltransferase complex transferase subunit TsaD [Saprospiraceae bacterium]|nr:tRNA (adenosine(37)-N6)-threonylcarbamoyltransferase complex transferase subunit TsaD [Saprospiraceae bacterium]
MASYILAIESSCDDTSAAVLKDRDVLSNVVASQMVHQKYGGVVPEVASRAHDEIIWTVVEEAIKRAGISQSDLQAIACTRGPGLLGSLLVGYTFAKALAYALHIPLIDVHHMQAHILAHFLDDPAPDFPFLCLTVSGGHTQLVVVRDHFSMEVIGKTLDDAAGEAFDKAGKLMNLPYPAGPQIDRLAKEGKPVFELARPQIDGLDFSFSGLKTSFLYFLRDALKEDPNFVTSNLSDLCASLQERIVDILIDKLERAAKETGISQIAIAGGVAANSGLRQRLLLKASQHDWRLFIPKLEYCTDNAAMIGIVGYYKNLKGDFADPEARPDARLTWND